MLPHHVPNLNDQLIQLGVVAMGDRTDLRRECQAVKGQCGDLTLYAQMMDKSVKNLHMR